MNTNRSLCVSAFPFSKSTWVWAHHTLFFPFGTKMETDWSVPITCGDASRFTHYVGQARAFKMSLYGSKLLILGIV